MPQNRVLYMKKWPFDPKNPPKITKKCHSSQKNKFGGLKFCEKIDIGQQNLFQALKQGVIHGKKKLLHEKCSKIGFFGPSA